MKNSKLLITISSILLIYTIIGFIAIPKIAKPQIEKIINDSITQKTTIEKIEFNPFLLKFSAFNLKISDKKTTTFSLEKLEIDFSLITSLDEKHINFKNLELKNPYINIIENEDGSFNLEKIIKPTKKEIKEKDDTSTNIKFQVFKTIIKNAKIDFTKLEKNKKPYKLSISNFNYTFYDMGTFKNILASHSLQLDINNTSKIIINGGLRLSPFEMYGNAKIIDLKPTQFLSYKGDLLNFNIDDSANINLKFGYKINTKENLNLEIDNAIFNLDNLNITKENNKLVSLKNLNIDKVNFDYPQNTLSISSINLNKLNSNIKINKNGEVNFSNLINNSTNNSNTKENGKTTQKTIPFTIDLKQFTIKDSNLYYDDLKNSLNLATNNINFKLDNLKFKEDKLLLENGLLSNAKVIFNQGNNDIKIDKLSLDTKNLELINNDIKLALAKLTISKLSMKDKKNKLNLNSSKTNISILDTSFVKNQIDIRKLLIKEPSILMVDKKNNQTIKAKNININIDKIFQKNNQLKIVKSSIDKPNINITLGKQINKKEKTLKVNTPKETKSTKKSDFNFDIGPVKINNMKMTFEDQNLPIDFKTDVSELNGQFSRFNSSSSKLTKLKLEGKVDKYGYTKITGTVDINDIKLLTNTNILFKNIAIKNFTPYSGKFIGREIDEGKLNLDLKYNIKKSDLDATNSIIISDIKLGKNVESADAVNLPLELAIALLEDSNGVIDIDLPIKGNVDDPEFSIAPIVWKAFTNLILKAVTAPFALLGALFDIDEEKLKTVQFEVGNSDIIASERESLDAIAKILKEKNKLAINIEPIYDEIEDKNALQIIKVNELIKKQMANYSKGDKYKLALEKLYIDNKFEKSLEEFKELFISKNKEGKEIFDNESYLAEIKNLLANKQIVSKEELLELTQKRVNSLKKYLVKTKNVDEDSLKILDIKEGKSSKNKWINFKLTVSTK
ncbi:DUF748 domain-containing protein [Halarcobacter sp.]|uniref:DUF748 domain-containing protein n=1 Tax=Halarcobacter sp. TaxID=2321133 RepID=UPI002AAB0216|nr:DUF748 domain-containing protein [Halarcobacter sp.]